MNLSLTQTLKDMLNIASNNSNSSFGTALDDSFANEDSTSVLHPAAAATVGSHANNLTFGTTQLSKCNPSQAFDLSGLEDFTTVPPMQATPTKNSMNGNVNHSSQANQLLNNCAFVVPVESTKSPSLLELSCPPPGDGDVSQCTNSNFCKIQKLIDYSWEKIANVNVLAICRSRPLIAYVLDPNYSKNVHIRSKTSNDRRDYSSQVVRFVNYEKTSERALSRTTFTSPIADIAFAFKSIREGNEDKLAAIDKNAVINVFGFRYETDQDELEPKLVVEKLFEILSDSSMSFEHLHLKWCPFVPLEDDYEKGLDSGMSLAVSCDSLIEVFAVDKICSFGRQSVERDGLRLLDGVYQRISDTHKAPITAVHLSNDATVICTAALDNCVKFFDLGNDDVRLLHNWTPKIVQSSDQISCFYFLDDYNYLLENSRHHFWAYLFIGTKNGNISIWDLGCWTFIQRITIDCENCSEDSHFEYRVDISAKVITAVRGENAFVFLLDFIELDSENGSKSDDEGITSYPRITKVGRFQLYTDILSFAIKRQSNQKVDIFWVSQKSLERCSIDIEQMTEKRSESPKAIVLGNASIKFDDEIEVLDTSARKLSPRVKDFNGPKVTAISTPPSVSLAQIFSKPSPVAPLNNTLSNLTSNSRRSSTPSQEVASLLVGEEVDADEGEELVNNVGAMKISSAKPLFEFEKYSTKNVVSQVNLPNLNADFKLPDNLVTLEQLRSVESSILSVVNGLKEEMSKEMKKVCQEVSKSKNELKDVSQVRNEQLNKIINGLIKKLMDQMNNTISKGLEEFMGQLRTEVNDVSIQVNKLKESLKVQCESQKQQQSQFEKVVNDLNKRMQDSNAQNQQLLKQLQQQLSVTQQLLSGVTSMSRSNSAVAIRGTSMTPQPSNAGYITNEELLSASLRAQQEEMKKKVEEERMKQIQMIMRKLESRDESVLLEGLVQALNLRDPNLVTQICRHFENKPEILVNAAAKDQMALLSLLQQLSLSDFRQEKWKAKFLTQIAPSLDMKSEVVRRNLSSFVGKLLAKLEEVLKTDKDSNLMLVNALFQSYMHQVSS